MKGALKQGWALCLTMQAWHPRHTSAPYPPPAAPQCLSNTVGQEGLRKCRRWWHVGLPSWTQLGACSRNGPSENTSWQMNNGVLAADLLASWPLRRERHWARGSSVVYVLVWGIV
ncbi:unnamed protein product [Polarella glacialis]|uniref:Uncharacterized protein n=1 Tax=Polarella glacialis TaxID=89957 RepID=A0A813G190_POLGL|nr:unnamed protein product [Polarella glacialis]